MKLTISMQITVDGVYQANGGNNDEIDPGFTRGGWALANDDAAAAAYILETWRRPEAFLLGRKTFELFARYWGSRTGDGGFGDAISDKPKYLVSNSVSEAAWEGTTVIRGDVAGAIRDLKSQPGGDLTAVGSGSLATWLLAHELVDELNLIQFPFVVGEGKRLFPEKGADFALKLTDNRVFPTGIVAQTYRLDGRPTYA